MREDQFDVVSVLDPAIDRIATGDLELAEYARTRDLSKLKFVEGKRPTLFRIREIPKATLFAYVETTDVDALKQYRAFLCGVMTVKNIVQNDGTTIDFFEPPKASAESEMMDPRSLTRFAASEVAEIGAVIYSHSFLARRIESCFLLPRSVREQLDVLTPPRAAANQSSRASSNGAPSSGAPGTTPNPSTTSNEPGESGSSSAVPTAASAAEAA